MEDVLHLLLIDDDEDEFFLMKEMLVRAPFKETPGKMTLDWTADYETAAQAVQECSYDVYLIDYRLGSRSGLDLLRLASVKECKSPVILLTGQGYYEVDMTAMQLGAADYLVKGELTPLLLERSIRYALDRKQQEEKLRRSELALKKAQNAAMMGTWFWFPQENRVEFSDEIYHLFRIADGYETTVQSWNVDEILQQWIHPDDRIRLETEIETSREEGRNIGFECRVTRPNGGTRNVWIEIVEQIRDGSGKRLLVTGIAQDITDRAKMEKALVQTEKMAGLGIMAAGMAHEINTPLQVITGSSESILNKFETGAEPDREELKHQIDHIQVNAWRIAAIVRSLLDYARIPLEEAIPCSLNDIVNDTLPLTMRQFLNWSGISITARLMPDLPRILCDPNKITQVLVNLLNNARDAMPDGGQIIIETGLDEDGSHAVLRVIDTGTGIPESIRDQIFDPFFTSKAPGKGIGLGLSVSMGIIQAAGGFLELEKSSTAGSVFKMSLPVQGS